MYVPNMNDSKCNLLKKYNLSIKDRYFDFVLVSKCPLFGGSNVYSTKLTKFNLIILCKTYT